MQGLELLRADAEWRRVAGVDDEGADAVLAEALAIEKRTATRQRLRELLLGFGAAGRQSVEQLKASKNPAVRRTAIYLLREFGGSEALPDQKALRRQADLSIRGVTTCPSGKPHLQTAAEGRQDGAGS